MLRFTTSSSPTAEMIRNLWPNVKKIFNPMDMLIFTFLYTIHVHALKFFHARSLDVRKKIHQSSMQTKYEESIFGFVEAPVRTALMFLPFVYGLDIGNVALHMLGFEFHIKGDLSRLLCVVYEAITAGMFTTKIKDYLLNLSRLRKCLKQQKSVRATGVICSIRRDHIREGKLLSSFVHNSMMRFTSIVRNECCSYKSHRRG